MVRLESRRRRCRCRCRRRIVTSLLFKKLERNFKLREHLKLDIFENMWTETQDLIIGVIYKRPSFSNRELLDKFEEVLAKVNITNLVKIKDTCDEKVQIMEEHIIFGLDAVMPLKKKWVPGNEAPRINNSLKLINNSFTYKPIKIHQFGHVCV